MPEKKEDKRPLNLIGKGFESRPENINRAGRPRKIYTILKESGYSKDDIREAYFQIAWSDINELQRLFKDDNSPAIIKVIAHSFKRAIEKGEYSFVQQIIEQVIGKPKETIDQKILIAKFEVRFNDEKLNNENPDGENPNNI